MLVEPLPKKQKAISLTPLVDVIFLLLLFFMLTSTFSQFGQVEISAPAAGGGAAAVPRALLVLEADRLRLNGETILLDQLVDRADALVDRQLDSLLVLVGETGTTQQLVSVMSALKQVPGLKLSVARSK